MKTKSLHVFGFTSLLAVFLFWAIFWDDFGVNWYAILVFAVMVSVAENLHVAFTDDTSVSLASVFICASAILFGPVTASIVAAATAVSHYDIRERTPYIMWLCNGTQMSMSAILAGIVLNSLNWSNNLTSVAKFSDRSGQNFPEIHVLFVCVTIFVSVFLIVNLSLTSVLVSIRHKKPALSAFRSYFGGSVLGVINTTPLVLTIIYVYHFAGISGAILLIAPLLIIRQMFLTYLQANHNVTEIVKTLISTIEAKDSYTRQHSERVAEYSRLIGAQLRLRDREMLTLDKAAYLHDIGKIAVKRTILNKPQRLTSQEMMLMKKHPVIGYKLIKNIKMLQDSLEPILKHHEFIGGGGYPLGTKEIPLMARIIAVADAYDAMTSLRPYRKPLNHQQAMSELYRNAGKQFDGNLVKLFDQSMVKTADIEVAQHCDSQAQLEFAT